MNTPVIVQALRTPIGRARKGSLVDKDAFELARVVVRALLDRTRIEPSEIDDMVIAESLQGGGVIARHTAVALGLDRIPGLATNRHCAASLGAIASAAGSIAAGMDRVVLAGGTESLSTMPMCQKRLAAGAAPQLWMSPSHPETPDAPAFDMSITVGHNTAALAGLSRTDVDQWAIYSHGRAIESIDSGAFDAQIVPVEIQAPDGEVRLFEIDEHPRRGLTLASMAELKVLHPEIEGFTVTAGNSAGVNDAAAAVLLADADWAHSHGIEPLAAIRSWAAVGVAPAAIVASTSASSPAFTTPWNSMSAKPHSALSRRRCTAGASGSAAPPRVRPLPCWSCWRSPRWRSRATCRLRAACTRTRSCACHRAR